MLFPDRLDFLILSPLSVRPWQMLATKAAALAGFFALFLFSSNIFGALVLPAVSKMGFFRHLYAHTVAVVFAGAFAALFFLALGGLMLCLLGAARFRTASPWMQMFSVMALVLLGLHYIKFGDALQPLLNAPGVARWMPPLWFLGVYEHLLRGADAPAFAAPMARLAMEGTGIVAAVAVLTYPVAWARMRRLAVEGTSQKKRQPPRWVDALLHRLVTRPGERAVFHFIGRTIARNNHYQVYLAMYCGTGLALAVGCAVTLPKHATRLALSAEGLHAVMPLLLCWTIAGLRTAFAFPLTLSAGWIFRISGVDTNDCARAGWRWVLWCAIAVLGGVLAALRLCGWDLRQLLVQAVCGLCLALLVTDGFLLFQQNVPFNQPRMPGKTSLPLMLTLYIGVFPPFIYGVIALEMRMEKNLLKLIVLVLATAVNHNVLRRLADRPAEIEEEMEGYEGEFQLLGLS